VWGSGGPPVIDGNEECMHVLVTNDDGIDSAGLWALVDGLITAGHEVSVVAPLREHSGASMSLTQQEIHELHEQPTAGRPGLRRALAYDGSPVGCVAAALQSGLLAPVDALCSGINRGLNTGTNVLLSGTVGAAMIGALWGLPAMALSLQYRPQTALNWQAAAHYVPRLLPFLDQLRGSAPLVLNVNLPAVSSVDEIVGMRQTRLSEFFFGHFLDVTTEPSSDGSRHAAQFRFARQRIPAYADDTDDGAVRSGYVSLTPLTPLLQAAALTLELGR
jgi:5'-nucleotidase